MDSEEVRVFIEETKKHEGIELFGYEDQEKGICPFITFYIYQVNGAQDFVPLADKILDIAEEFDQLKDEPFKLMYKGSTGTWLRPGDKRLPTDWRLQARRTANGEFKYDCFWYRATDMASDCATARWAICGIVTDTPTIDYCTLKLTFRYQWYLKNKARWHDFVQRCVQTLQPDQCYSGFEVGNGGFGLMGSFEGDVMERISADYFYGMDIDKSAASNFHNFDDADGYVNPTDIGAGLRPPTWCFALSPYWLKRLGLQTHEVRSMLSDPRIKITDIAYAPSRHNPEGLGGLWIELGELSLYPVEDGVPDLLVKANALIRPVRCDYLKLTDLTRWDDDPNPVFDPQSSVRWMQRFDEDSDWPNAAARKPMVPAPSPSTPALMAHPSQPCPKAGLWFAPRLQNQTVRVELGEPMPVQTMAPSGAVIWYYKGP
jgi:hypothetical protein